MNDLRWHHNVLLKNNEVGSFWKDHFTSNSKLLFVLGKGFDPRMNVGLESVLTASPDVSLECILIEFDEGRNSPSVKYKDLVEANTKQLNSLVSKIVTKKISVWAKEGEKKSRIGDRQAAKIVDEFFKPSIYTDVIVDISALPRSIFFSLVGKMLTIIDDAVSAGQQPPNFFVLTSENAEIDYKIVEEELDEDLDYQHGFTGSIELYSDNRPVIWLPLLGEGKRLQLEKAYLRIKPSEICPILPFPSKDPRRSDDIFIEHREILFDVLRVEAQNIMYVPEQNPFEVYKKLISTIDNYDTSLSVLKGCKAVITTFCSKLLSIGALLASYELSYPKRLDVGVLHVDSQGYKVDDPKSLEAMKNKSELFVTWLTGDPYKS